MLELSSLPLWPDTVTDFYADRACSIRSDATRRTWGYTYRKLQRLHPDKTLGEFRTDDLVAFVTQRGWDTPRWAPCTARNYRIALQSLFGWAHHAERISIDPAWRLGQLIRIRRRRVWPAHWLTETQIAALLATANRHDVVSMRDRTLLMLGLFAGLRCGELNRLRWRDVDVDHGVIRVHGKDDLPATVTVSPQLHEQLAEWRRVVGELDGFSRDWPVLPVFMAPHGDTTQFVLRQPVAPLTRELIRRVVNRHGNTIGLDYLRPHDLRRTLAGTLDARGVPLQDIQLVLRHDTLGATQRYLADNPLRVRRRMRSFVVDLR